MDKDKLEAVKETKKTVVLNSIQVASLQKLAANTKHAELVLLAAEKSSQAYVLCIADSHEVSKYIRINLDAEKKELTFVWKKDDGNK